MTALRVPVLIVGGGPAGLVLALALIKNGVQVRIIEKEMGTHKGQRGAGTMPRSQEVYHYLGLLPDVLERGQPLIPTKVYKLPGGAEVIKTFYLAEPMARTPSTPYINILSLGQDRLEALLRDHLEMLGCHVEERTTLTGFQQHDGHVEAQVVKAGIDQSETETISCDWLVGADGAKGTIRKHLGLPFSGETRGSGHRFITGDIQVKNLSNDYWHVWGDPSTILVSIRSTENPGIFHLILGGHLDYEKALIDREELQKVLRAGTDREDLELGKTMWLADTRPNIRMTERFSEGRVFLAGDSCHVHPFFGAQGLNSSIQDSFNLAWKLALVHKRLAHASLLSTYTAERVPVIMEVLKRTARIYDKTQMMKKDGSDLAGWDRGGATKMLGINYRWSPVVVDERNPYTAPGPEDPYGVNAGDVVRAGDRAPDAPNLVPTGCTGGETSLFDVFGSTYHTVLLFVGHGGQQELAHVLEKLKEYSEGVVRSVVVFPRDVPPKRVNGTTLVVTDAQGHAYNGYRCADDSLTVVIIRPDGVVGAIVFGVAGMKRYFKGVFSALAV